MTLNRYILFALIATCVIAAVFVLAWQSAMRNRAEEIAKWKGSFHSTIVSDFYIDRRIADRLRNGDALGALRLVELRIDGNLVALHVAEKSGILSENETNALRAALLYKSEHRGATNVTPSATDRYLQESVEAILRERGIRESEREKNQF